MQAWFSIKTSYSSSSTPCVSLSSWSEHQVLCQTLKNSYRNMKNLRLFMYMMLYLIHVSPDGLKDLKGI